MNADAPETLARRLEDFRGQFQRMMDEVHRAIVGYDDLITDCLVTLFCQGHVLLEGVPGIGKTYLVRMVAKALGLRFGRIQCTPDLMPADILGTHILGETAGGARAFRFEKGPVFNNIILVDEINRATPKTQAALLEVMQERRVTAGGETFDLPRPFFVLATQNPIEMEGTYPLPEAQLDRFLVKLHVPFPGRDELVEISRRTTGFTEPEVDTVMTGEELLEIQRLLPQVPVADPVASYAAQLVLGTHPDGDGALEPVSRFVAYGASPRGLQALIRGARTYGALDGRTAAGVEDVQRFARPALRHRVILNFEGEAESVNVDHLLGEIIDRTPTPAEEEA